MQSGTHYCWYPPEMGNNLHTVRNLHRRIGVSPWCLFYNTDDIIQSSMPTLMKLLAVSISFEHTTSLLAPWTWCRTKIFPFVPLCLSYIRVFGVEMNVSCAISTYFIHLSLLDALKLPPDLPHHLPYIQV